LLPLAISLEAWSSTSTIVAAEVSRLILFWVGQNGPSRCEVRAD